MEPLLGDVSKPLQSEVAVNGYAAFVEYNVYSHRFGRELFQASVERQALWSEIDRAVTSISDTNIVEAFEKQQAHRKVKGKSISKAINDLLKTRFSELGWKSESRLFQGEEFGSAWALDFTKTHVSVEVGFNHGSDAAWNVLKPTLASQLNHIEKEVQTDLGVIIAATPEMKEAGGFDGAIGTTETYKKILIAMQQLVTVPIVIIGLLPPRTFRIEVDVHENDDGKKKSTGKVKLVSQENGAS